jgi:hypothetical protein
MSSDIQKERLNKLKETLGSLFPSAEVTQEMMVFKKFPMALSLILKYAKNLALQGTTQLTFQPLTAFSYADGQQMITVTGILLNISDVESFFQATGIKEQWKLANTDWKSPKSVNIPDLTIRERLLIDSNLPKSDVNDIQDALGFLFDKKESTSKEMLENYLLFYRYSPYFSRILL